MKKFKIIIISLIISLISSCTHVSSADEAKFSYKNELSDLLNEENVDDILILKCVHTVILSKLRHKAEHAGVVLRKKHIVVSSMAGIVNVGDIIYTYEKFEGGDEYIIQYEPKLLKFVYTIDKSELVFLRKEQVIGSELVAKQAIYSYSDFSFPKYFEGGPAFCNWSLVVQDFVQLKKMRNIKNIPN